MLTKRSFTRNEWDHLWRLLNIMNLSMFSCGHFLSNRKQSVMSKKAQASTPKRCRQWWNRDQWIWCQGTSWVGRKPLLKIRVLRTAQQIKLDQSCVSSCGRKLTRNINQNPTIYSQESQQDDTQSSSIRKLGRRDEQETGARWGHPNRKVHWKAKDGIPHFANPPTIDTMRKSSRTCGKSWLSQKRHQWSVSKLDDQRVDLGIIHVDNDESLHSPWTKLRWQFGSFQEHKLRGTSEFIRFHAEIDIRPTSWDSGCDNESRGGKQKYASTQMPSYAWRNVRSFRSESKMAKSTSVIGDPPEDPKRPAESKRWTWEFWRSNYLHANVQWHRMDKERKFRNMYFK